MNLKIFCLVICLYFASSKLTTMNTLRINHLKNPLGIDITDNNFSFKTNEKGPFRAKILLGNTIIEQKEIKLENSHSFTFDKPLEYNKRYKYVVEGLTNTGELEFETSIKLENSLNQNTRIFFLQYFSKISI